MKLVRLLAASATPKCRNSMKYDTKFTASAKVARFSNPNVAENIRQRFNDKKNKESYGSYN